MSKTFSSLRNKLIWPFVLLGFSISSVLSVITFGIVSDLDQRNIRQTLLIELENFKIRKMRNAAALPIHAQLIQSYFLPHEERAELDDLVTMLTTQSVTEPLILHRMVDGRLRMVGVEQIGDQILAVVYDNSRSREMRVQLIWLLAGATGLMTLLSTFLGYRLAGQVVRPISKLLTEIEIRTQRSRWPDIYEPLFSSGNYPANEIGRLALSLDRFATRLQGFVQRERFFSSDVSHELRTPIAIIRGAAEVAGEMSDLSPQLKDRLDLIQKKASRLSEMLDALLILGREKEQGPVIEQDSSCFLSDILDEVIVECQSSFANRPVRVSCAIHNRPFVAVERSMVYVVISNLVRNAFTHTESGEVRITLMKNKLFIEDSGIGIPEDRFPTIFDRFTKGDSSPGNGLGLSIVARMIEVMNWKIEISSKEGVGTCVTLTFDEV